LKLLIDKTVFAQYGIPIVFLQFSKFNLAGFNFSEL